MDCTEKYFPGLDNPRKEALAGLFDFYRDWNSKINVISRKDMDNFCTNHVLHSLAIAKLITFHPGTTILDAGTGGGFPGIPLAIMFPECDFTLVDSIEKKVKVVREAATVFGLKNVTPLRERAENVNRKFDFVVSRAVTALPAFVKWVNGKIATRQRNAIPNGILYLKGGDFGDELKKLGMKHDLYDIADWYDEEFFVTKKVVHIY